MFSISTLRIGDSLQTPADKCQLNRRMFEEIAPYYAFITRALSFGNDAKWKREMLRWLPPLVKPVCLDLATGTGDIALLLAQRYPDGEVTGLDLVEPMLASARSRNRSTHLQFQQGDMMQLPYNNASVDIITGGYALRNAPDLAQVLTEISRVLKPGGIAAFLDFSKPANRWATLEYHVLKYWTSLWGLILHRNAQMYGYIAESLAQFPDREALIVAMERHALPLQRAKRHMGGFTETWLVKRR